MLWWTMDIGLIFEANSVLLMTRFCTEIGVQKITLTMG